ncbi:MAG: lysophospholipid acyltransferase family protein [Flavobacteriales bacterium]
MILEKLENNHRLTISKHQIKLNYILYYILKAYALLPMFAINSIGKKLAFLLKLFSYRKHTIENNLKMVFPNKSQQERTIIKTRFYNYFGHLLAECIKLFGLSENLIKKRITFKNDDTVIDYLKQQKDIIVVLGHYGNWEWAFLAASLHFKAEMVGIYKPLSSPFWNNKIKMVRSQFGATLLSMKESLRYLLKKGNRPRLIGIVGDQTPSADELNYWINFLNQKTPVFLGAERLAKKLNCPVFYANIIPKSHSNYEIRFELITDTPNQYSQKEITNLYSQQLENNIKKHPAYWLWSHRRWKHQK